ISPPPSPVTSLPGARRTYSPGALNVAVVAARPSALSTGGLLLAKETFPGPRNLLQLTVTGVSVGRRLESTRLSSVAHSVSGNGLPTDVVSVAAVCTGGPWNDAPFGSSL